MTTPPEDLSHPDLPPGAPITPLPVAAGVRTIVLFGGTFDPPHRGHVELAEQVHRRFEEEPDAAPAIVLFVPAARSPFKEQAPEATDQQRVEMLRAATEGQDGLDVWTDELDRARWARKRGGDLGPSYTVDTVRRAHAVRPERATLRLLIGADQARSFHKWREPRHIIDLAEPIVLLRTNDRAAPDADTLIEDLRDTGAWSDEDLDAWRRRIARVGTVDVSATRIRELIRAESADDTWRHLVPEGVDDVIKARGLYWG